MTTTRKPRKTSKKAEAIQTRKAATPQPIVDLPPNPFTFEVLSLASKQRSNAKKVEVLRKYEHNSIKAIFIWNYDDSSISLLPPGEVPYSSLKDEQNSSGTLSTKIGQQTSTMQFNNTVNANKGFTTLRREWTKLYNFVKGGNDKLNGLRRETMFIQILEGLHPLDAEILCLVKDKKLYDKYKITKENVSEAYPDIVWGNRS
jgi:hypothetical protein|tara:strand:- start:720 stop:1325 length:606 start_codon:yes stop_codon:yes gene_type:complete